MTHVKSRVMAPILKLPKVIRPRPVWPAIFRSVFGLKSSLKIGPGFFTLVAAFTRFDLGLQVAFTPLGLGVGIVRAESHRGATAVIGGVDVDISNFTRHNHPNKSEQQTFSSTVIGVEQDDPYYHVVVSPLYDTLEEPDYEYIDSLMLGALGSTSATSLLTNDAYEARSNVYQQLAPSTFEEQHIYDSVTANATQSIPDSQHIRRNEERITRLHEAACSNVSSACCGFLICLYLLGLR